VRENRTHGSEGGEVTLPDPYHFKLWISDKTFGNDDPLGTQPSYHPLFNAIALTEFLFEMAKCGKQSYTC
jgi:hypothetical protein